MMSGYGNNPSNKYAQNGDTETSPPPEPLQFFNYHEFLTSDFKSDQSRATDTSLVVNHFPNYHEAQDSLTYASTRIVRIPRIYTTTPYSDIVPQFSPYTPGMEPAALTSSEPDSSTKKYDTIGMFDGNWFGATSITPLVPSMISADEYNSIITKINHDLLQALSPKNPYNIVEGIVDLVSVGMYSLIYTKYIRNSHSKRKLLELEKYIEEDVNGKLFKSRPNLKLISLRKTGYLSLDFQIPKP